MSLRRNNWVVNLKSVKEGFGDNAVGRTKKVMVGFGYQNGLSAFLPFYLACTKMLSKHLNWR